LIFNVLVKDSLSVLAIDAQHSASPLPAKSEGRQRRAFQASFGLNFTRQLLHESTRIGAVSEAEVEQLYDIDAPLPRLALRDERLGPIHPERRFSLRHLGLASGVPQKRKKGVVLRGEQRLFWFGAGHSAGEPRFEARNIPKEDIARLVMTR
jgi:hypothetical protein